MASVDDVHATASGALQSLEQAETKATEASQQVGDAGSELAGAKDEAEALAEATSMAGYDTKAAEVDAVREELEALAAEASALAERLTEGAAQAAAIRARLDELLARIQALGG